MDLITQGVLGAAVGQVYAQHKLERKALIWGAVIGMAPDLDVLVKLWGDAFSEMIHHRGFTHSIFFAPLMAPIMGYLLARFYKTDFQTWAVLCFWALLTHPLLDVFTVYGTQLLNPISDHRFAFNGVPIIDITYTGSLFSAVLLGIFLPKQHLIGRMWAGLMLIASSGYLFYGVAQHDRSIQIARNQLIVSEGITPHVYSYTGLFSIFSRRIVVDEKDQIRIAYMNTRSINPKLNWEIFPKTQLPEAHDHELKTYYWFTDGRMLGNILDEGKLRIYDIRFGAPLPGKRVGLWGIEFPYDAKKNIKTGPAEKFHLRAKSDFTVDNIMKIWRMAYDVS